MEYENNTRRTKTIGALALTAAAALAFSGCGDRDQMVNKNIMVENDPAKGASTNYVSAVNQPVQSHGFPWFWWYVMGRSSVNNYSPSSPGITPRPGESYSHISPPVVHSEPPAVHIAPPVTRGGFGSIGRGSIGGIGS